ncbi:DUF2189 domain-containing protein [Flavobacterium selenitireducens]|uniref:hypothetical protein n=1 Tax=Flavobacterium selenitireducens TaxID=2722704 RepID=UPI00168B899F|nr:hypothetical protein [Flavobacterium selenitireducens]MBD3581214.1 hypothetical protein [Flavobacterium selenitireducens]
MERTQRRLEEIKTEGYRIDFSDAFNDAFEIYKRVALMAGLAFIVCIITIALLAGGIASVFAITSGTANYFSPEDIAALSGVNLIIYILSTVVLSGFVSPFLGGLMVMARNVDAGEDASFSDAFSCFRQPYFVPLFVQSVLISAVSVGVSQIIQTYAPGIGFLGTLFSLFVSFITMMTVPLVVFGNMPPVEAIQGSVVVVMKSPGTLLGLVICAGLLSLVGLIAFCIGIFFTVPFLYVMYYVIYKHSVGITVHDEIEDIGESDTF